MNMKLNLEEYTILIVDDNPTNLGVIADYLEDYECDVITARDGKEALERAEYVHPDIILLDVMMPGIDGFETCRRLKANKITQDIPIIFMTALASVEDKVKGFETGAVDYVTKPLHQEEILARVTTHLRIQGLTRRLQKSNKELANLNLTKDKFFSIVAHDLRGPFTPLLGMSELLLRVSEQTPYQEVKETGEVIHRTLKSIYKLLENLLQWSQIEQGQMEHQPKKIHLKQTIDQAAKLFTENAATKGIHLQNTLTKELFVYADENMLNTVIRNLISNALKFTSKGGQVTISVGPSYLESEFVEVSVLDTGVGISQEDIDKLFNLKTHHTTAGTAHEMGTGLGLILCQEMVEKNGGQIWLESEVGHGTTIKFTIPLDKSNLNTVSWPQENTAATDAVIKSAKSTPTAVKEELLISPPQEELTILLDLTLRGNMIALEKQADHLEAMDEKLIPFANKLRRLTKNFEDEQILTFIEQYAKQNS